MDGSELRQKLTILFQKYRCAVLVLLAGILLMLLPVEKDSAAKPEPPSPAAVESEEPDFESKLSSVLSQIEGAGKVQVFLSLAAGEETLYQTDENIAGSDIRTETVLVTDSDRTQWGLIQQINPPVYRGAIVLCQGADNASIRLSVTEAVANATGLKTNQISVLKMK